jgi:fibronectin type 3 domain-containing protein
MIMKKVKVELENKKNSVIRFDFLWLLTISLAMITLNVCGQENKTALKLIVRPLPDSILLRWAPDNFDGWNAGNKYGYNIVRFTLMKDGAMISQPKPEVLTSEPIKPWPLPKWEKYADADDYVAVAAQAIYGETFEITAQKSTNVFDVVNKVKEQDSRFTFALFAADQSRLAAKASGLWFTDRNVKKGEKYLYRIYLAVPQNILKSDTAFAYTGIDEYMALPKPLNFKGEFGDKSVLLHWDRKTLESFYTSYSLERSDDGKNFKPLREKPLVYANSGEFEEAEEMMFTDSLAINGKEYYYRLAGFTPFGERSPYSEVIKGKGFTELKSIPDITKSNDLNGSIILGWKFTESDNINIIGFKVLRSKNHVSGFDTISKLLAPEVREYTDKKPRPTNYYKIAAIGKNGSVKTSLPTLVQLIDSIPPSSPIGLKAIADTTGKLILNWHSNQEEDIYGYRIYRANAANEEFAQLTVSPIKDTTFIDHINLKTLTSKIYYQVMAIDKRQNHSDFSQPLEVERPDIVPPSPPVIKKIKSTSQGIELQWIGSSSSDVAKHLIYRKSKGDNISKIVKEIPVGDTLFQYTDTTVADQTLYYYRVIAEDKNGLRSVPTLDVAGQKIPTTETTGINGLKSKTDTKNFIVTLTWNRPSVKVSRYILYKKQGETGVLSVYSNIPGEMTEFNDKKVKAGTKYTYCIMPEYENGNNSSTNTCVDVDF